MSDTLDILTTIRAASSLLERAQLALIKCDELDDDVIEDLAHHTRNNRVHVDLTAGRLHAVIVRGGELE